jgi:hypothetical protein
MVWYQHDIQRNISLKEETQTYSLTGLEAWGHHLQPMPWYQHDIQGISQRT